MFEDKKNLARISELEEQLQASADANDELLAKITDTKVIVEKLQATNADNEIQFQADLNKLCEAHVEELSAIANAHNDEVAKAEGSLQEAVTAQVVNALTEAGQPAIDFADNTDTDTHLNAVEKYHALLLEDPESANSFYRKNSKEIWTLSRKK